MGDYVSISYGPLREYLTANKISYYYLANQGIDAQTLQRLKHDKPISTKTLGKLCAILDLRPEQIIEFIPETRGTAEL